MEAVFGQTSVGITVELVVLAASSSSFPSSFFSFASTSCSSSGIPAVGCDSGGGEPEPGEAGDAGEAGEAGETGDGGDVGEVGDGGE